jgi:hypothetical protein
LQTIWSCFWMLHWRIISPDDVCSTMLDVRLAVDAIDPWFIWNKYNIEYTIIKKCMKQILTQLDTRMVITSFTCEHSPSSFGFLPSNITQHVPPFYNTLCIQLRLLRKLQTIHGSCSSTDLPVNYTKPMSSLNQVVVLQKQLKFSPLFWYDSSEDLEVGLCVFIFEPYGRAL